MTREEKEALIAAAMMTPEGRKKVKGVIQQAAASAADSLEAEGKWFGVLVARHVAGLPMRESDLDRAVEEEMKRRKRD